MDLPAAIPPVRKSVEVPATPQEAFALFTRRPADWWPRDHRIVERRRDIVFEPFRGGRWYERDTAGTERDWGHVLDWAPPRRLRLHLARLLLNGGHDSTASMITLGTLALLRHPDQLRLLRDDPGLAPQAVEELLRLLSITDLTTPRVAKTELEIGGVTITTLAREAVRNSSDVPSKPGLRKSMIDDSSARLFSTGVPVSATRCPASSRRTALAARDRLVFTACAPSSTTRLHPYPASSSMSRLAVA